MIHVLALRTFYGSMSASCLDVTPRSAGLGSHAAGVEDTVAGRRVAERHESWGQRLPKDPASLWTFVKGLEASERVSLLAYCASLTVFAVREPWDRSGRSSGAADILARETGLDMTAHWKATTASYFGRTTKAQIIEAVREGASDEAARRIEKLAKPDMAQAAETLFADLAWLPTPLRTAAEEQASPA